MNYKRELLVSKLRKMKLFIDILKIRLDTISSSVEKENLPISLKISLIQKKQLPVNIILDRVIHLYNHRLGNLHKF